MNKPQAKPVDVTFDKFAKLVSVNSEQYKLDTEIIATMLIGYKKKYGALGEEGLVQMLTKLQDE